MERRTFLHMGVAGLGTLAVAGPAAAQFVPMPSKEKWAVIFGTWYGTARDAAVWVSEGMGGIAPVFDARQAPADLGSFDHLVIGTAIQGGKGPKALEDFIKARAPEIRRKTRGLFAVCGNLGKQPGPQQVKDYVEGYLGGITGAGAVPGAIFGGRITRALMEPDQYKMVTELYAQMGGPKDDFDNLSRVACMKFGAGIRAARA